MSTSGTGLHQFVLGGLRKRGKFIAPIDDDPFVPGCEDLPQVEIYEGGRHVAMTGQRVAGSDRDVVEGQSLIDTLVSEYAAAEKDAGHRRYDPESGDGPDLADDGQTSADTSHTVPDPDTGAYLGPSADTLLETKPDDRSLTYHVVVETFYRGGGNTGGYAHIQNWRLEGFAAALGQRNDLSPQTVKRDLGGAYLADTDVEQGCVHRTPERIDYAFSRTNRGRLHPPSWETLADYGILPPEFLETDGSSSREHGCEDDEDDGRELLELDVVVEPAKAMRSARAVESDDLDCDLPELCRDDVDDVAIAVALADGRIDDPATFPRDDGYTDSYYRARDVCGAPLPKYLDNSTLAERFDHIYVAVSQICPEHILDELQSEIILENPPGQAIAKIDPVWEETSNPPSGRIVAGFWCAEHDQADSFSPLQLVALEHSIISDESRVPNRRRS